MAAKPAWVREELKRRSSATLANQDGVCVSNCTSSSLVDFNEPNGHGKSTESADNGDSLDDVALVALLKACTKQKDLCQGIKLHAIIVRRGSLDTNIIVGNCLVNIYAKCGALKTAQKVLNELPVRDVVSWTTVIARFCEQGRYEEALDGFDQMLLEGLCPDQTTLTLILKACGNRQDIERGKDVHAGIVRQGWLDVDCVLGSALLDMYAKCGIVEKSQQVFIELPSRDLVAWNSLISGYAQWDYCDEAMCCFQQSLLEGLPPDIRTFTCLLKVCASRGALEDGKRLHAEIAAKGLLGEDVVLGSALIDMYSKCEAFTLAKQVFDELPRRNEVSWTSLIMGFCQQMHGEEALACFEQMKQDGYFPDRVTFACILKACGSVGAAGTGQEIHCEILRLGLLRKDTVLGNALVDMYGKCGAVTKAQEVFDYLPFHNLVSWNALIAGYSQHGYGNEALARYKQLKEAGLSPDTVTYTCVLKACGSIGAIKEGNEIHAEVARKELLGQGIVLGNAVVDMYAKCGALPMADQVFSELSVRDVVSWNTLISGYCDHGFSKQGLDLFEWMKGEGLIPNAVTFACILKACGSIEAAAWGEEIHNQIIKTGQLDTVNMLGNTLIATYGKCGVQSKAQKLFEQLPSRDVVSWNALIGGCCKFGFCQEALTLFELMNCHSVNPDDVTFACILKACSTLGASDIGNQFYTDIVVKGIQDNCLMVPSAIWNTYTNFNVMRRAEHGCDHLQVEDLVPWDALVRNHYSSEFCKEFLSCSEKLKQDGLSLDVVTWPLLLQAFDRVGHAAKV